MVRRKHGKSYWEMNRLSEHNEDDKSCKVAKRSH